MRVSRLDLGGAGCCDFGVIDPSDGYFYTCFRPDFFDISVSKIQLSAGNNAPVFVGSCGAPSYNEFMGIIDVTSGYFYVLSPTDGNGNPVGSLEKVASALRRPHRCQRRRLQ